MGHLYRGYNVTCGFKVTQNTEVARRQLNEDAHVSQTSTLCLLLPARWIDSVRNGNRRVSNEKIQKILLLPTLSSYLVVLFSVHLPTDCFYLGRSNRLACIL